MSACVSPRTAVVVVVQSDLAAPAELASVRAAVGAGGCADGACVHDFVTGAPDALPFSFVVEPRGGDASARFTLGVAARDAAGRVIVERHVESGFVAGRTILLRVALERACRGVTTCAGSDTCVAGACVTRVVDPGLLPVVTPGRELDGLGDAGAPTDAPLLDAPPIDVGPPVDVGPPFDAGRAIPTSCAELPGAAPSGLTTIDPDGAGGAPPFDAWCENDLDDGGWTLIAKIDPTSMALRYDAPGWTSANPDDDFGIADESAGDALLRPYWTVPIRELRIRSASGALVTTGTMPATATLRVAIAQPAEVPLEATVADWRMPVPGLSASTAGCTRSGIDVSLPAGAPEIRVRIGLVGGPAADCSDPAYWFGVGASVATSRANCVATTNTAGGGRVCAGAPPMRGAEFPELLFVYGR